MVPGTQSSSYWVNFEVDALLLRRGVSHLADGVLDPAIGPRMEREQPALRYVYQQIGALNDHLDRPAILGQLVALRTTTPAALKGLAMPVLCLVGDEDGVIPPDTVAVLPASPMRASFAFPRRGTRSTSSAPPPSIACSTSSCRRRPTRDCVSGRIRKRAWSAR